ncbi:MAG: ClpP/crotonase-like domain-containing protein [Monoraphidium minutum]|nr:MAG: ClpP/crotonase-like domain-containing protein [Monoraphidium minutum]
MATGPTALYRVDPDGVAIITLQNAPVNALHPEVLRAVFTHAQAAHADARVKAIVVTGAGKNFSAGFDINQFVQASGGGGIDDRINDAICAAIEGGPKPTVAAVQGVALGGGLEVAMGCNARVALKGSRLGLPELQLGIIPGFGGTQRLPRLVGLQKAIEMMLTSAPIKAEAGAKLGLVDVLVDSADGLLPAAKALALDIAAGRRARMASLTRSDKIEPLAEGLAVIEFARAQAAKRARNLQHPQLCLDAIQEGLANGGPAGLKKEGECFAAAAALDTHKALVHIFFAQRSTKKVRGVTDGGLSPRPLRTVAVLGGGLMGSGIATALALAGVDVILKEVNQTFLDGGMARVKSNLASRVKKGRMTQAAMDATLGRVRGALDYAPFANVDMVIEAVIEDIPLKQRIFADLEAACPPHAILATNTSTIDIDLVGAKTKSRDRIVGAHFFSPAHVMPLLEIVRTTSTSKQVVLDTLALASTIKKTPVVVGNCTGFAVNRVFFPYTMAACLLADCGANPYQVDAVIAGDFGMPMGPFRLNDLVGSDIGLHVGKNFVEAFAERVYVSHLIPSLFDAGRLGEKSGAGFYKYDARRRASPDPEVRPLIEKSVAEAGILAKVFGGKPPKMTPQEVIEFIFFPVVNEGCRVIAEGIVDKPADLDVASVMAMGFPPYRGGLIFWADLVGAPKIVAALDALAAKFGPTGAGGFFVPCEYLRSAAAAGRKLSAGVTASRL